MISPVGSSSSPIGVTVILRSANCASESAKTPKLLLAVAGFQSAAIAGEAAADGRQRAELSA